MQNFRSNGAIGALLDEYERALHDLLKTIEPISDEMLLRIVDADTKDENCRSIQAILTHVVRAGLYYAVAIRNHQGESVPLPVKKKLPTVQAYKIALEQMFAYNEQLFEDYPNIPVEVYSADKKLVTSWGQLYDVEQIMEHAIVHILRHRRQIERILQAVHG